MVCWGLSATCMCSAQGSATPSRKVHCPIVGKCVFCSDDFPGITQSHTHTHTHTHHTAKRKPGMSPQMLKRVTLWESQSTLTPTVAPSPLTSTPHTSTNGRREDEGARALPEIRRYPFQPKTIPQVRERGLREGGGGRCEGFEERW